MSQVRKAHSEGLRRLVEPNSLKIAAWLVATVAFINAVVFVLRCSNPVIQSDSWYFLDVFLRHAIEGHLSFADFFVKRAELDHAQPLFKLIMLFEWRYFDLDFTVDAVAGVIAAMLSAIIFYRLSVPGKKAFAIHYLAWAVMCAILFSLNGYGVVWTWPLVALENITNLIILLFMLAVWHAHRNERYIWLSIATLVLGITSDDSALIAVAVAVLVLLLAQFSDPEQRRLSTWKLLAVVAGCILVVRIGYSYAPVTGVTMSVPGHLGLLIDRFSNGGWWQWIALPLILPVYYSNIPEQVSGGIWSAVAAMVAIILLCTHIWFWSRALRSKYSLPIFVAVCLMALSYAWVAGIIYGRVASRGNEYLYQQRYVLLYSQHLLALLLMWSATYKPSSEALRSRRVTFVVWPVAGCLALLLLQVPVSHNSWKQRPFLRAYYSEMAKQIDALASNPADTSNCLQEVSVCFWPIESRRDLTRVLRNEHLNIFSLQVQHRHHYLPSLPTAVGQQPTSGQGR